jgi:hypothetical protein
MGERIVFSTNYAGDITGKGSRDILSCRLPVHQQAANYQLHLAKECLDGRMHFLVLRCRLCSVRVRRIPPRLSTWEARPLWPTGLVHGKVLDPGVLAHSGPRVSLSIRAFQQPAGLWERTRSRETHWGGQQPRAEDELVILASCFQEVCNYPASICLWDVPFPGYHSGAPSSRTWGLLWGVSSPGD